MTIDPPMAERVRSLIADRSAGARIASTAHAETFKSRRRLEPLRASGVLVVASGNVVHNLREIDWSRPDDGFDWAQRFDDAAREILTSAPADAPRLTSDRDYPRAAPTPDHFLPVLYLAGIAAAAGRSARVLVDGYTFGSLSMTSYTIDGEPTLDGFR